MTFDLKYRSHNNLNDINKKVPSLRDEMRFAQYDLFFFQPPPEEGALSVTSGILGRLQQKWKNDSSVSESIGIYENLLDNGTWIGLQGGEGAIKVY